MGRIPNHNCPICQKAIYKRDYQLKLNRVYCSKICFGKANRTPNKLCVCCGTAFWPQKKEQKYCSIKCVNHVKIGTRINPDRPKFQNVNQLRLHTLKEVFNLKSCMVDGCSYDKTYDVHRLVEGKNGGKYEIGNMFAICPNHHAEVHRKICKLVKISDSNLKSEYQ